MYSYNNHDTEEELDNENVPLQASSNKKVRIANQD